jgi:hypothetical protein
MSRSSGKLRVCRFFKSPSYTVVGFYTEKIIIVRACFTGILRDYVGNTGENV